MHATKPIRVALVGLLFLLGTFATSAMAQVRDPRLVDSQEPGSVIVFPLFSRGFVTPDGVQTPRTEFEVGVVCPKGVTCPEGQKVKVRFHYVCGTTEADFANSFTCKETDFDAFTTVNGKMVFNTEGTAPGNTITPSPQCQAGYLIGWVEDTSDRPIKFDGLIGDAVVRLGADPTHQAVSAYKAIPIQADPALANGALISLGSGGSLIFDGGPGHYQAVTGVIYADVAFDKFDALPFRETFLVLLTLDVLSNRPNYPAFVDLSFYNAFENLLSASTEFICWRAQELLGISRTLTAPGMGSRKGIVVTSPAEKVPIFGISDTAGPVTLLGLVVAVEFSPNVDTRTWIYDVFNNSVPVPTQFVP